MKKILAIAALILIVTTLVGCGAKVAPPADVAGTTVVEGESEISGDVTEVTALESELGDAEAEAELDAIGDMFSDW